MEFVLFIGKLLFSYLFLMSGVAHFKSVDAMTGYAKYKKLPFAKLGVLASGVLLIVAPLLFLAGIAEAVALVAIALFLTATAFIFHAYWTETDAQTKMNEQIAFNKEISLIGATLVILSLL
jgi:uncharacterized membrane protein YphA (DoxX/SURF4 family)